MQVFISVKFSLSLKSNLSLWSHCSLMSMNGDRMDRQTGPVQKHSCTCAVGCTTWKETRKSENIFSICSRWEIFSKVTGLHVGVQYHIITHPCAHVIQSERFGLWFKFSCISCGLGFSQQTAEWTCHGRCSDELDLLSGGCAESFSWQ